MRVAKTGLQQQHPRVQAAGPQDSGSSEIALCVSSGGGVRIVVGVQCDLRARQQRIAAIRIGAKRRFALHARVFEQGAREVAKIIGDQTTAERRTAERRSAFGIDRQRAMVQVERATQPGPAARPAELGGRAAEFFDQSLRQE